MLLSFDPQQKEKLRQFFNTAPQMIPPFRQQHGGSGRAPVLVRCTSATAAGGAEPGGTQCYPAVVVDVNSLVATQADGCPVWLTILTDGTAVGVPVDERVYFGEFAGNFDPFPSGASDPRPRVFATTGVGSAAALTYGSQAGSTSVYTITSSTFTDTGHAITLPSAGDYLLWATMSGLAEVSAGPPGYITFRLHDATAGAAITPTLYAVNCAVAPTTGVQYIGSGSLTHFYTSSGANTIRVQAARGLGPTWTNSLIQGSAFARTLGYLKLS